MTEAIQREATQVAQCSVRLHYFAAVAEAAGTNEEHIVVPAPATAGVLRQQLSDSHGKDFARVLAVSALLANGLRLEDDDILNQTDGLRVDVLPPFAGG